MRSCAVRRVACLGLVFTTFLAGGFVGVGCCQENHHGAPPIASASAQGSMSSSASASASASSAMEHGKDDIQPVYPIDAQPPLPLAQRYCELVKETPAKRRDACCPSMPTFAPANECARTLSAALRSGAVGIEPADLDACADAVAKETAGCDWVGSLASPTVPACLGIIKGKLNNGAVCRSSLECAEGSRCRGLGATHAGKCAPPLPAQRMCNIAVDSLATFAGQDDVDRHHPECEGYCARKQCLDALAVGAACVTSLACGPKNHCIAGKCSAGPLPGPGEPCTDACVGGTRCWKGKCVQAKTEGDACENDGECRIHCEMATGTKSGKCAQQCPSFPSTTKPPARNLEP
jgi:hypothetical protein